MSDKSIKMLEAIYPDYCKYAEHQDAGCKGKDDPCKKLASDADGIRIKAWKFLSDSKASKKILSFNRGPKELGNSAMKLIARKAMETTKNPKDGFKAFIAEIEARFDKALKA